ncbi:methylated-DNA--[protein]-cysteine S-methyltransferase [[Eubacterium] cellulosolvens]
MILSAAKRDNIWYATVTDEKGRLVACSFSRNKRAAEKSAVESLPRTLRGDVVRSPGNSQLVDILNQIYAGRGRRQLPHLVLLTTSRFLRRVYERTMRIPKGKVTTYGRLAGSRKLSRAVGNAMARNPLPLIVPCHRVVPSALRVGNYGAAGAKRSAGTRIKQELLVREGVQFDGEKVSQNCVWDPY